MQYLRFYYLSTLSFAVTMFLFSSLSWAGSSLQADTSKPGSSKTISQGSSGKTSDNHKGKDFLPKDKSVTQNKQIRKNKIVIGFCCVNGVVKKAGKSQCEKLKGVYYLSSIQARKSCNPKRITCCVDGKLSTVNFTECKQLKGTAYTNVAEAKRKCKPVDAFCCVKGNVSKTSPKECKRRRGTPYKSMSEAKKKCKPEDVFCCVKGKVSKTSPRLCEKQRGIPYKSKIEAKKKCLPEDVFCCADGKVSKISSKKCAGKNGTGFQSRTKANRRCNQVNKMFNVTGKERKNEPMARSRNRNPNQIEFTPRKKAAASAAYGTGKPGFSETRSCTFSGQVLVDEQEPPRDMALITLRLWSNERAGSSHISRNISLSKRGAFTFHVPPSATSYSLKPSFPPGVKYRETFHNGSLSGVAELMCWEDNPQNEGNIILRWSSPQAEDGVPDLANSQKVENTGERKPGMGELAPTVKFGCNYVGRVLVDGQAPSVQVYVEVKSSRRGERKPSFVKELRLANNGTFSVYVPKSAGSYSLKPFFAPGNSYREDFYNGSLAGTAEFMCREDNPQDENNIVLRWSLSHSSIPQDPGHRFNGSPNSSL